MNSVEHLTKRVKAKQAALEKARRKQAPSERETIIKQAIETVYPMDFYCDRCGADFRGRGRKTIQRMFSVPIAFYEARCRCGAWCRRYITDQHQDPYYRKSPRIREMRARFSKDFLQPGEPGFNTLYGDPYKPFYDELEQQERAAWQRKPSIRV